MSNLAPKPSPHTEEVSDEPALPSPYCLTNPGRITNPFHHSTGRDHANLGVTPLTCASRLTRVSFCKPPLNGHKCRHLTQGGEMSSYTKTIDILEDELTKIEKVFRGLTEEQWRLSTKLSPLDPTAPHWTLFELAGHFDISIGLTRMLIADPQDGQPGRDRVSFFIFPRSEVAPVVYDYAYQMVAGKTPGDMPDVLHETFAGTIREARATPPETIGPGYYALMRLDEFVASRIVEAVVHGIDLTDPLERECIASTDAIDVSARILDDLLARKTVAGRPTDLADGLAWIRAASGRAEHPDPRLPLIG